MAGLVLLAALALVVPLVSLLRWLLRSTSAGLDLAALLEAAGTTLALAAAGGVLATVLAVPVAWLAVRHRGPLATLVERSTYVAGSLPGIVVALALVTVSIRVLPSLYQTVVAPARGVRRPLPAPRGRQRARLARAGPAGSRRRRPVARLLRPDGGAAGHGAARGPGPGRRGRPGVARGLHRAHRDAAALADRHRDAVDRLLVRRLVGGLRRRGALRAGARAAVGARDLAAEPGHRGGPAMSAPPSRCAGCRSATATCAWCTTSTSPSPTASPRSSGRRAAARPRCCAPIAGFVAPDAGTITVADRLVVGERTVVAPRHRGLGYVPQEGGLFPHLDVAANVVFGLPRARRRSARAEVGELLELVDLPASLADRHPHELSGGQQQRVALARALAPRPSLVLLDEPFSSLDAGLREETGRAVVRALRLRGAAAVLVTHDQGEALSLADQVAVMHGGRFLQVAEPTAVYLAPADERVAEFVGLASLLDGVVDAGAPASCAAPSARSACAPATPAGAVRVAVRAEQVHVTSADRGVTAEVLDTSFFGHDATVRVRLPRASPSSPARPAGVVPLAGEQVGRRRHRRRRRVPRGRPRGDDAAPPRARRSCPRPTCRCSAERPAAAALVTADRTVTYAELAGLVAARGRAPRAVRRLVLVEAAQRPRRPSYACSAALARRTTRSSASAPTTPRRHARHHPSATPALGARHDLHPDLALLLSTSGSTGSPKLVRLSHDNCGPTPTASRPTSHLTADDRAITSLPLHYCYGLSVLTSHLRAGAARGADRPLGRRRVLLGPRPPPPRHQPRRRALHLRPARRLAASPRRDLPALRYLTQAGGRMAPRPVRRWAELGQRRGWDLFVMYGATEATARMAYLPPHLAAQPSRRRSGSRCRAATCGSSRCPTPRTASASSSTPAPT